MNKNFKNVEILAKDISVSRYSNLHWNDVLEYGKDKIANDLMTTFYHKYLEMGFTYRCRVEEKYSSNTESGIEKVTVYLYVEREIEE